MLWLLPVSGRSRPIATGPRLKGSIESARAGAVFYGQFGADLRFLGPDGTVIHAHVVLCPQTATGELAPGEAAEVLLLLNSEDTELLGAQAGCLLEVYEGPVTTGLLQLGAEHFQISVRTH